jgi:hypothetical protein
MGRWGRRVQQAGQARAGQCKAGQGNSCCRTFSLEPLLPPFLPGYASACSGTGRAAAEAGYPHTRCGK